MPRASSASMSRASAAGARTCGRCQIEVQEGNFAKHQIVSSNDHISPRGAKEERYDRVRGLPERPPPLLLGADPRRPRRRRAAGYGGQRAGRAQGRQRPRHRAQRRRAALLCRGRRARHAQAARRSRPAEGRAGARLGLEGPARRAAPHPAGAEDPAQGQLGRHRRHPPRHGIGAALHHRRSGRA